MAVKDFANFGAASHPGSVLSACGKNAAEDILRDL